MEEWSLPLLLNGMYVFDLTLRVIIFSLFYSFAMLVNWNGNSK